MNVTCKRMSRRWSVGVRHGLEAGGGESQWSPAVDTPL